MDCLGVKRAPDAFGGRFARTILSKAQGRHGFYPIKS